MQPIDYLVIFPEVVSSDFSLKIKLKREQLSWREFAEQKVQMTHPVIQCRKAEIVPKKNKRHNPCQGRVGGDGIPAHSVWRRWSFSPCFLSTLQSCFLERTCESKLWKGKGSVEVTGLRAGLAQVEFLLGGTRARPHEGNDVLCHILIKVRILNPKMLTGIWDIWDLARILFSPCWLAFGLFFP